MPAKAPRIPSEPLIPELVLPERGDATRCWAALSALAARNSRRRWFLDISELVVRDWGSGIQRVVKNLLLELLLQPPAGHQVVPVYATGGAPGYRVAREFMLRLGGLTAEARQDPAIEAVAGDLFFGIDLQPHVVPRQKDALQQLAQAGVRIGFMVYDLLPIRLPQCFVPGGDASLRSWLEVVAKADFAVCISQAVSDDVRRWFDEQGTPAPQLFAVHLGSDLAHSLPTQGAPLNAPEQLEQVRSRPTFLMVGTIEPRKGHAAVLAAMESLWAQGDDVGLVIVGQKGWMVDELVERLRSHPEAGLRLLWIEGASDEYLGQLYVGCSALLAASVGEGFGLPLVEAARHGVPIVARDLPVFREVAADHAFYFADDSSLAARIGEWIALWRRGEHPRSAGMAPLTWAQSAAKLKEVLLAMSKPR